jgi:rubredoxin
MSAYFPERWRGRLSCKKKNQYKCLGCGHTFWSLHYKGCKYCNTATAANIVLVEDNRSTPRCGESKP